MNVKRKEFLHKKAKEGCNMKNMKRAAAFGMAMILSAGVLAGC